MSASQAIQPHYAAGAGGQGARGGVIRNVGPTERVVSQIGGGLLVALGIERGGLSGLTLVGLGAALFHRGYTGHCHLYEMLGVTSAETGPGNSVPAQTGVRVDEAITIQRTPEEVFQYWRSYDNLPRFMPHIESVTGGGTRSHWVARGPFDNTLEWHAEINQETPNELIAWRSVEGGDIDTAGSVRFTATADGQGTVVRVNQKFNPPAGRLGIAVGKLLGFDPAQETRASLVQLKRLLEAGE